MQHSNFLIVELIIEIKENADTLSEIDALWLTLLCYVASMIAFDTQINLPEFQAVFLVLMAPAALGKQFAKQFAFLNFCNSLAHY